MSLYNTTINFYFTVKEVSKVVEQIKRLTYHVPRCNNQEDTVKLIAMIALKSLYVKELIKNIDNEVMNLVELPKAY
jgi:hypothetical protein